MTTSDQQNLGRAIEAAEQAKALLRDVEPSNLEAIRQRAAAHQNLSNAILALQTCGYIEKEGAKQ